MISGGKQRAKRGGYFWGDVAEGILEEGFSAGGDGGDLGAVFLPNTSYHLCFHRGSPNSFILAKSLLPSSEEALTILTELCAALIFCPWLKLIWFGDLVNGHATDASARTCDGLAGCSPWRRGWGAAYGRFHPKEAPAWLPWPAPRMADWLTALYDAGLPALLSAGPPG
jgi:hypothetical protein